MAMLGMPAIPKGAASMMVLPSAAYWALSGVTPMRYVSFAFSVRSRRPADAFVYQRRSSLSVIGLKPTMSRLIAALYGYGFGSVDMYAPLPLKKSSSPSKNASTMRDWTALVGRYVERTRANSRRAAVPVALSSAPGAGSIEGRQP